MWVHSSREEENVHFARLLTSSSMPVGNNEFKLFDIGDEGQRLFTCMCTLYTEKEHALSI